MNGLQDKANEVLEVKEEVKVKRKLFDTELVLGTKGLPKLLREAKDFKVSGEGKEVCPFVCLTVRLKILHVFWR